VKLDCVAQQRDVTPRLTITRFRRAASLIMASKPGGPKLALLVLGRLVVGADP
jgi:hypothetical protein